MIKKNTKGQKEPVRKTSRRELTTLQRAIAVEKSRNGASTRNIAAEFTRLGHPCTHAAISSLVRRTEERLRETGLTLLDEEVYQSRQDGRGRRDPVLTEAWKDILENAVTASKESRRIQAQHIADQLLPIDFPKVSKSTIESALYERGYKRVKGSWTSYLTQKIREPRPEAGVADTLPPVSIEVVSGPAPVGIMVDPSLQNALPGLYVPSDSSVNDMPEQPTHIQHIESLLRAAVDTTDLASTQDGL